MPVPNLKPAIQRGFTLLELAIGTSVLAVSLLVMTGALFPQAQRSTDPWFQVRSAELAHSMMNEILARKFDESNGAVGDLRCGEYETGSTPFTNCATQAELTACNTTEEANRADFDDVDDFNCLNLTGNQILNVSGGSLGDIYAEFTVSVNVAYAGSNKRITVTVEPPRGDNIVYSAIKANY